MFAKLCLLNYLPSISLRMLLESAEEGDAQPPEGKCRKSCIGQSQLGKLVGEELGWLLSLRLGGERGRGGPAAAVTSTPSSGSIQWDPMYTEETPAHQMPGCLVMA